MLDKTFFHYALCFIKYWVMANMLEHFNSKLIVWTLKKQTVVSDERKIWLVDKNE